MKHEGATDENYDVLEKEIGASMRSRTVDDLIISYYKFLIMDR